MTTPSGNDFPGGAPRPGALGAGSTGGVSLGSVGRALGSPRALTAWVLVTFVGLLLFFEFFRWILPAGSFASRSASAQFHQLAIIAMPVLAVLLAMKVTPAISLARLIAAVALVEYAIALFLGFITLLTGLGVVFDAVQTAADGFGALRYLVMGMAELVLMGTAAWYVLREYLAPPAH